MTGGAPPVQAARAGRPTAGPARESWILLPLAFLLPVALGIFTLLSYRSALGLELERQREHALLVAEAAAARLAAGASTAPLDLQELAPGALRVVLGDRSGRVRALGGQPLSGPFLPAEASSTADGTIFDPDDLGVLTALVTVGPRLEGRVVRVDFAAGSLAAQRRGLRILGWVVVGADIAVTLWLVLFLRRILAPYDSILARARELRPPAASRGDETEFLLATLEEALAQTPGSRPAAELEVLEETLGASFQTGLLLLDRSHRVLVLNPIGAQILGLPTPSPGASLGEVLAGHPTWLRILQEGATNRLALQRETSAVQVGGVDRSLGFTTTPLQRPDGDAIGYLVLFSDLTSFRQQDLERHLAESLANLGELSAGVAHELRNSLSTIRGHLALLSRTTVEASRREHLHELDVETRRVERVVADFLAFARPERARLDSVDLVAMARHAATDPSLAPVELTISTELEAVPTVITGDRQLLEQALKNLLRNAFEAQGEGPAAGDPIELVGRSTEAGMELLVLDRGPGIPPEIGSNAVRPFVTSRPDGVGLGLALAHRIVTLHGGRLLLEERLGGGTVARLVFPATADGPSSEESPEDPERSTRDR